MNIPLPFLLLLRPSKSGDPRTLALTQIYSIFRPGPNPNPKISIAMAAYSSTSTDSSDKSQSQSRRLYNPYQDLQIPYKHIYDLPTSPEFLFQEESVAQRRSWGENLTYYTGIGYLTGAASGASLGLYRGVRSAEPGDTMKLRLNRILNSSGHEGRKIGNRLGVIGLLYAGMESGMVAVRDTDDWINSVVAGLGTGAIFRAANGVRSAAVAGAIGGLMVGAVVGGKQMVKRYVPI